MILSGQAIRERLDEGEVFAECTWDEKMLKEASYALRIASDGLIIDGKRYPPGQSYPDGEYIEIKPGKIAILSTQERLIMPDNLVGKIGLRIDYAMQGLTGLMGIQVDPLYGNDSGGDTKGEPLYIRIANLGNESVRLLPGDDVFTFELHTIEGDVEYKCRDQSIWDRIQKNLANQSDSSWSYATRVQADLSAETENIRNYLQPVVMFGVFLVAVTILGVVLSLMLSVRETPRVDVPIWVNTWTWGMLIFLLLLACIATLAMACTMIYRLWRR